MMVEYDNMTVPHGMPNDCLTNYTHTMELRENDMKRLVLTSFYKLSLFCISYAKEPVTQTQD